MKPTYEWNYPKPKMRIVEKEPSFTEVWLCPFIMAPQEMVDH